jgi:hypothetical protein
MRLTFCVAEDRVAEESGMRLTLLSLRKHHPQAALFLYRPNPAPALLEWLKGFPQVTLIPEWPGTSGWNCKPQAMLGILDRGFENVIWLDSDVVVTRPFEHLFNALDGKTVVVAEEPAPAPQHGTSVRTLGWNLPLGRKFPVTMNSCLLRVTQAHRPLLTRWNELLSRPDYVAAQKRPYYERPIHFFGDQDALNALMGSAEFAHVPVLYLRRGRDVAHTGGARTYTLGERLRGLFHPSPPFLHNQWTKPWVVLNPQANDFQGRFWVFHRIILEASPYVAVARIYQEEMGTDTKWMSYSSLPGRMLRALGLGHCPMQGLPLTAVATATNTFNEWRHRRQKAAETRAS